MHRWHGEIRFIKTQQGNSCNLKSMCLEGLEIYPVVLPTKRNLLYPTLLVLIIKKKRGKLKTSADSTQEQNFSKYRKWIQVQQKKLHPFWTESILEKPKNLLTCTISDCENLALDSSILVSNPSGLGSDSSNSVLDPSDVILGLSKSAKRLPEGS